MPPPPPTAKGRVRPKRLAAAAAAEQEEAEEEDDEERNDSSVQMTPRRLKLRAASSPALIEPQPGGRRADRPSERRTGLTSSKGDKSASDKTPLDLMNFIIILSSAGSLPRPARRGIIIIIIIASDLAAASSGFQWRRGDIAYLGPGRRRRDSLPAARAPAGQSRFSRLQLAGVPSRLTILLIGKNMRRKKCAQLN